MIEIIFHELNLNPELSLEYNFDDNFILIIDIDKISDILRNLLHFVIQIAQKGNIVFDLKENVDKWGFYICFSSDYISKTEFSLFLSDFHTQKSIIQTNRLNAALKMPIAIKLIEICKGKFKIVQNEPENRIKISFTIPKV